MVRERIAEDPIERCARSAGSFSEGRIRADSTTAEQQETLGGKVRLVAGFGEEELTVG